MDKPTRAEIRDVEQIIADINTASGATGENRSARRAAKARLKKQIKRAKKKFAGRITV